jgi:serine/threonine-protein kinase
MSPTKSDTNPTDELSLDDDSMEVIEEDVDPLIGTKIAERYRVDEKLGEGGMGAVYRGMHVLMQKPVAIKVLHREMTVLPEIVQRFEREAVAAGRIDHPNVAAATDFGKLPDGSFFLVLEYVRGKQLTDLLHDGPVPQERALFIARQIASALAAAHAANIVHRDLKPDNVMLIQKAGTDDFVKVLDFGIAKVDSPGKTQLTQIGSVFGTPQYMSPEQAQGKTVDRRADLYALGLLLHEMLRGEPTFQSEEMVGLLTAQMTAAPPPLPSTVDAGVSAVVMKLLEKNPDHRFQTAEELVAALDEYLGPVALAPESGLMPQSMRGSQVSVAQDVPPGSGRPKIASIAHDTMMLINESEAMFQAKKGLTRSVRLGSKYVPVWAILGACLLIGVVVALVTSDGGDEASLDVGDDMTVPAADEEPDEPATTDKELALVEVGNKDAMQKVLAIDEDDRTAEQWRALGRGNERLGEVKQALVAYRKAVAEEPKYAKDKRILRLVRQAVEVDDTRQLALGMAADDLGERGADLLFQVWSATSKKTPATIAAKEYLDTSAVQKHASDALRVALELRDAKSCADFKRLLPRVKESGDRRSLRPLQKLLNRKGCGGGFLGLGATDCYACLRGDSSLTDTIQAVQVRSAPMY